MLPYQEGVLYLEQLTWIQQHQQVQPSLSMSTGRFFLSLINQPKIYNSCSGQLTQFVFFFFYNEELSNSEQMVHGN